MASSMRWSCAGARWSGAGACWSGAGACYCVLHAGLVGDRTETEEKGDGERRKKNYRVGEGYFTARELPDLWRPGVCSPCTRHTKWHQPLRLIPSSISTSELVLGKENSVTSVRYKRQKVLFCQKQEAPLLDCRSMEEVYDSLAQHLLSTLPQIQDSNSKYIIGLAGPPGAGKSTVAREVVRRINSLWSEITLKKGSNGTNGDVATVLPMDGFHLYRSQLDQMEDPKEAHARRGAPWTFNPVLLLKCLRTLRKEGSVYAPSFDHGVGDPVENDIHVSSEHKVVIVEGNYLLLEEDAWKEISLLFDEKWFIDIDINIAMERVMKRHISTGKEPDVAAWRIGYNDRPNAELIMKSKNNADLVIQSIDL